MLTNQHIAQVEMLATVMSTIIARQLLAAFVIFENCSRLVLWESEISKQTPEPDAVFGCVSGSHQLSRTGAVG